ncbi:head-tail adaptor protein [Mameliella alba]|uniref:phage head completion protein n=1 Tax=Mameliella alba TaxID=561184 RepID=UPI000887EB7C|nr:head-tail adaptor protein [Mameliella alba]MBY6121817.1 head-tail adaptor protein [Mameliella alba]OWV41890.1 hypothetical protein CDZ96_24440 [Mameliella alba]PTR35549.1 head-tail joining protein [Mameliella alba]SDE20298.1 Phage head-tail joining protein [Mameliella alba]GGF82822.1 hypothetical protein GCM10011319_48580 [Mameliella alba]
MSGADKWRRRLAFDAPAAPTRNAFGEDVPGGWTESHVTRGDLIYQAGSEAIAAARYAGRQVLKVKIRTGTGARAIKVGWRMRLLANGTTWDVKEVDAITQRAFVFLVIEGPVS